MISFNSPTIKLHLWPTAFLGSALTNKLFSLGFIIISLSALLACSFPSMSVAAPRVEKKSQERNVHIGVYKGTLDICFSLSSIAFFRDCHFVSSVRSSSGYHGLIEIRQQPTFSNFSNSSDSKVKVKVKGPNMCYIFEKHGIQGYRI